jgi:TPR repeat protein
MDTKGRAKDRRGIKALIGAALLLLLGATGWWGLSRDRRAGDQPRPAAPAVAAEGSAGNAAPASAPLPQGAFRDIRQELEVRARAGDAQAAYRLGQVIGRCREYQSLPGGGAFTEMLAQMIAKADSGVSVGGRRLDDPELLDVMLYGKEQLDAICAEVGDLPPSVRKGDARAWFELAAERGHAKAMVDYTAFAFEEFATEADLLDNAAEVAARRERARGYLRRAFEAGEPESLLALAASHGHKPYLGRNITDALAYWKAYRRTGEGSKLPAGVARMMEAQLLGLASPQQLRDSERRSLQILQAFQQRKAPR